MLKINLLCSSAASSLVPLLLLGKEGSGLLSVTRGDLLGML